MKTVQGIAVFGLLLLGLASCGDVDPVGPGDLAGEYQLLLVNGSEIPVVSYEFPTTYEKVTGGVLTLERSCSPTPPESRDGCYVVTVDLRTIVLEEIIETTLYDQGFWGVAGGRLQFESRWAPADVKWSGTVAASQIVLEMNRTHMPVNPDTLTFVP
jgi:hypothetical protein